MITSEELLEKISIEDVINILIDMGSKKPKKDDKGNLYFTTICHGGDSHKLHFFTESKFFMCYTNCGSMSLYDVLMNTNDWTFKEAFNYLARYKNINVYQRKIGLHRKGYELDDELSFLDKHLYIPKKNIVNLPEYNNYVLNIFDYYCPDTWIKEGISEDILKHFNTKFYFNQLKAVIPHYDIYGHLVGIKSRNFLQTEIDSGRKYMPITIQGLTYKYPVQFNLYGLYQNQNAIIKAKTAIIFESEKSVFKYGTYYGQENNIAVAVQGMTISLYQRDLILQQGVENVIIAFDKQYMIEFIDDKYKNTNEYKDYIMYLKKLLKIVSLFINYCNVHLMLCWDDRINYKDSPIDCGKKIFEELYQERYLIEDLNEIKEMIN
jgi:hypothetical protein